MTTTTAEDGITPAVLAYVHTLYGGRMLPSTIIEALQKHLTIEASTRLRVTAFGQDVLVLDVIGGGDADKDGNPEVTVRLNLPGTSLDVDATVEIPASALKTGGDALFVAALAALGSKVSLPPAALGLLKSLTPGRP